MQTQTLEQLVQGTVNTFLSLGQSFSVYDITANIRNLVNSGAVEPIGVSVFGDGQYFVIEHSEVKKIFTDLYEDNGFLQTLNRTFNGSFFEYVASGTVKHAIAPIKATVSPVQQLANAINSAGKGVATSLSTARKSKSINFASNTGTKSSGALDKNTVVSRVRQYLSGCRVRGVVPTPRQIQSAIKRNGKSTGWSRLDLNGIRNALETGSI